jgi:hypothetical protein
MTWAVMCECSGAVRDALLARGVDAVSIDLKPTRKPGPHIQGNALDYIGKRWAGVIAHPVCRRLTNAGAKHLYIGGRKENGIDVGMWLAMEDGARFFNAFKFANAPKIAIENPIPHCHARALIGDLRPFVQPWWFGDRAFKATGFWLKGLQPLRPTNKLTPPAPGTAEHREWSFIHRMPPGPDREERRSNTFPGVAAAMADQWALGADLLSMMEAAE